jgi:hypothetical protein
MADDDIITTDRFADAIALCQIAKNKTVATQLKKLRRVNRQIADAEAKVIAVQDQAEQMQAALADREAAIDERERALDARETAFAASAQDVRDELYAHHNRVEQAYRQLVHRIMATAGILGEWNWDLQSPPSWSQLRKMIANLPDDLPATPPAEVVSENVREDWSGNVFSPSTLTRSIVHKVTSQ